MSVSTSMGFLARVPLYDEVKPYRLKFVPPSGLPESNIQVEQHDISIHDVRTLDRGLDLQKDGFAFLPFKSAMHYEDFDDDEKIKHVYLKELAQSLKTSLSASRVQIFEHLIRKANPNFPLRPPEDWHHIQPTTVAHVGTFALRPGKLRFEPDRLLEDLTRAWGETMARRLNHKIGLPDVPSRRYQYINIWKPLRGPVRDWPLALCDPKSVGPASLQDGDVLFEDFVIENKLLQHESKQKWYYASNQDTDEIWVFLQADSSADGLGGVPHASFQHSNSAESTFSRETIEIRAIVYYQDSDGGNEG